MKVCTKTGQNKTNLTSQKGRNYIIYKCQEVQKKMGKEVEVDKFSKQGNKIKLT